MTGVGLGDDVRTVRSKIGMELNDYQNAWKSLNIKAQGICHDMCGNTPLKDAKTLPAIAELKNHNAQDQTEEPMTQAKIVEALQVDGAAAWIIHNAIKRNYEKYKKASRPSVKAPAQSSEGPGPSTEENNVASKVMWDLTKEI